MPPVFLQTGFRTGGTWLWSRFRENPEVLAFCEPLNEALETFTRDTIGSITSNVSNLNHPALELPYFHEFGALLSEHTAGVRHYRAEFGLQTYFEEEDRQPRALAQYLYALLDYARACGKQPVLKFTRALARAGWLKHTFPQAKQIVLTRHPWSQFQSGWKLAHRDGNFTFLMIPLFALSRARTRPIRDLCQELGIPRIPFTNGIAACAGAYTELAQRWAPQVLFGAFLGMYIASHSRSTAFADLVIDQEVFERDCVYRRHVELNIYGLSGLRVNLSNYQASPNGQMPILSKKEMEDISSLVLSMFADEYPTSVEVTRQLLDGAMRSMPD